MNRRSWLALAVTVAVLAAVPALALAARSSNVTRGLDYLHAQQSATTGGFSSPTTTAWAILGAVATGERMGSSAWTHAGKNPIKALQATNHVTAASATLNSPVYYSQVILAYKAGANEDYIYSAGTPGKDLLTELLSYQDKDGDTTGSFSPSTSNPVRKAVRTTSWAILAMHSLSALSAENEQHLDDALVWLSKQKNSANGGFGVAPGSASNPYDTALAIQALTTDASYDGIVDEALDYLDGQQKLNGGFASTNRTVGENAPPMDTNATACASQAIDAAGESPTAGRWVTKSGETPFSALRRRQLPRGAFETRLGVLSNPISVTGNALVALSRQNFKSYPRGKPSAVKAFVYLPHFGNVVPKGGTTYKTTQIVLIRATYGDGEGGTGINVSAVRLYVDSANKTKPADVGPYGLHLQLKNVSNGKHSYKIVIHDRAGNERQVTRNFTVAVPIAPTATPTYNPTPVPTTTPTYPPPTYHPSTSTPTPSTTLYPTPTTSGSPYYPTPTPSTSGSPVIGAPIGSPPASPTAGSTAGDGGGSPAGFLGGTLLAMLPLGAALTYYLLHRREETMAGSVVGEELPGGGSGWEHTRDTFAKSGDVIKPARS